jgi:hypothetical protein
VQLLLPLHQVQQLSRLLQVLVGHLVRQLPVLLALLPPCFQALLVLLMVRLLLAALMV